MTTWIEALKIWNGKRGGKYMIPRKGTQEHAQVMSIMKGQQNGKGIVQLGKRAKKELEDNVDLYQRTKKNIREANRTFEATKPLQKQSIKNLKRFNSKVDKYGGIFGGSLEKAVSFATQNPEKFVEIVNQQQTGSGMKKQKGGFLPAFIIPFIPAITTALGAFATGAAGAAGAAVVDELVGSGLTKGQIEILNSIYD